MNHGIRRRGILLCVAGPAGSGKTSLSHRLLDRHTGELHVSISVTSRKPREGEQDGIDYHFVTATEFRGRIDRGEFVEWEEVHGNYYGTLRSSLEAAVGDGRDLLLRIDIRGSLKLKQQYPRDTVVVFIVPPSAQVLRERLVSRGKIERDDFEKRMQTALHEYELVVREANAGNLDYLVLNREFDQALDQLHSILVSERARLVRIDESSLREVCQVGD